MLRKIKARIYGKVLDALGRALCHPRIRDALLDECIVYRQLQFAPLDRQAYTSVPYADLGKSKRRGEWGNRQGVVFVTGRFRSGTTLLWNIFRNVAGCTSYYEPFNERRWFDPARRGNRIDGTHLGVSNYWDEYEGLAFLSEFYDEDWTRRGLLMGPRAWNPRMKQYIEALIAAAPGRPVLQFNRIDFRLPWVRRNFPAAKIVHVYRHPRDQWCSMFQRHAPVPRDAGMAMLRGRDEFYLHIWRRDLRVHFPFLDDRELQHPYQLHYFLWKLSYLFGEAYADVSLKFEDLVGNPVAVVGRLFQVLEVAPHNLEHVSRLCSTPQQGRWRDYADDAWFSGHESHCEDVLAEFFNELDNAERISEDAVAVARLTALADQS